MTDYGDFINRLLGRPTRWEKYQEWAADQERQGFVPEVPVTRYTRDDGAAASLQDIAKERAWTERIEAAKRTSPRVKEDRLPFVDEGQVTFPASVPGTYDVMPRARTPFDAGPRDGESGSRTVSAKRSDDGFVPRAVTPADDGFTPRKVTPPAWKGDTHGVATGAVLDTLGLTDRPGADTVKRVLTKPQGAERLIAPAIASPLIYAGGLAAGAGATAAGVPASVAAFAPTAGRVLTTGGISAAKGEDAWHTAIDMIGATIGEGAGAAVGKAAAPIAKAAESLQAIRDRISAGASGAVNTQLLDMFVQRIKSAPNDVAREAAVKNAVQQLNQMGQGLGTMFRRFVVNARASLPFVRSVSAKVPMGASSAAGGVRDVAANPAVRSVIDAALGTPPLSAVATSAMLRHADRIPGVKEVVETAEGEP